MTTRSYDANVARKLQKLTGASYSTALQKVREKAETDGLRACFDAVERGDHAFFGLEVRT